SGCNVPYDRVLGAWGGTGEPHHQACAVETECAAGVVTGEGPQVGDAEGSGSGRHPEDGVRLLDRRAGFPGHVTVGVDGGSLAPAIPGERPQGEDLEGAGCGRGPEDGPGLTR